MDRDALDVLLRQGLSLSEIGRRYGRDHKTIAYWVEQLNKAGVPCGPINTIDQTFADPQVQHLGMAAPVEHSSLGKIEVVNQAIKLSRTPSRMRHPTPEKGEHTDEVLKEYGYDNKAIAEFRARKIV